MVQIGTKQPIMAKNSPKNKKKGKWHKMVGRYSKTDPITRRNSGGAGKICCGKFRKPLQGALNLRKICKIAKKKNRNMCKCALCMSFRTESAWRGTGRGLATTYSTWMAAHSWQLWVARGRYLCWKAASRDASVKYWHWISEDRRGQQPRIDLWEGNGIGRWRQLLQ